ncbi:hypothetical protein [Azospirillum halopraeferens]|uniref:hypothetical protein n=1 Tax=Azospirillum halopraeferens TaxID=34010 RepID=UPI00048AECD4|nr:hypothetical protein [Azospirillum halopraeferens]
MEATSSDQDGDSGQSAPGQLVRLGVVGLQGHIDAIESSRVYGWAWNPEAPEQRVSIDILHNGAVIGRATADRFRQDLADVSVGDGHHAFVFDLPPELREADPATITAYFCETQMPLSRGSAAQPLTTEHDRLDGLAHRIDRIEAALQQVYRALNAVRRSDDDSVRGGAQELQAVSAKLSDTVRTCQTLESRLDEAEKLSNAAHGFIQRLDAEIHDRLHRSELDDLHLHLVNRIKLVGALAVASAVATAVLGYVVLMAS